jgi:hypothetical protein
MARSVRVNEALNVLAAAATRHCIEVAITHVPDGSLRIERIGERP